MRFASISVEDILPLFSVGASTLFSTFKIVIIIIVVVIS